MEKIIVEIDGRKFETAEKLVLGQIQYLAKAVKELTLDSLNLTQSQDVKDVLSFVLTIYEKGLASRIIAGLLVPADGKWNADLLRYLEARVEQIDGETQKKVIEYFFVYTLAQMKDYLPFWNLQIPTAQQ